MKITYTSKKGLVQEPGSGFLIEGLSAGGALTSASLESLSGPGAASVATTTTNCTAQATNDDVTLADGTVPGQLKRIALVAETAGGDSIRITPANFAAGTTVTIENPMQEITFIWDGSEWRIFMNMGGQVA